MTGAWPGGFSRVGFVTGLRQEARIAAALGGMVEAGGGTRAGALAAAARLVERGAEALVSFGIAGGLDPALDPGALLIPRRVLVQGEPDAWADTSEALSSALGATGGALLGARDPIADAAEKRRLFAATGCGAVDLESGAVAELAQARGLPFAAFRTICDPAQFTLPPAALVGLTADGGVSVLPVLGSVLRRPAQIPDLLALARCAAAARAALKSGVRRACRPAGEHI